MLSFDDPRWDGLKGGYRVPFDPRPVLRRLETEANAGPLWRELWNELHHQGDVGEASYAAVPRLVHLAEVRNNDDWNPYALVCIIDVQRQNGNNPPLPEWLKDEYAAAIQRLSQIALHRLPASTDDEVALSMLAVVALAKGLTMHAEAIIKFSAEELRELLPT